MSNGISLIAPIPSDTLTADDLISQALQSLGGGGPSLAATGTAAVSNWEAFEPEQVQDPALLPAHWLRVFNAHFDPARLDCQRLRLRYVHAPTPIISGFPRAPRAGIFCLSRDSSQTIVAGDLVHLGDELDEMPDDCPTDAALRSWLASRGQALEDAIEADEADSIPFLELA